MAKPFLKWVGGKTQLMQVIKDNIPPHFNVYHEPFLGGGAVYFNAINHNKEAYLNDVNDRLIQTYEQLKNDSDAVLDIIVRLENEYLSQKLDDQKRDFYDQKRIAYNAGISNAQEQVATFILLNKTCFNGVYRENSKGEFNVPFGTPKDKHFVDRDNLAKVSKKLSNAHLSSLDFNDVLEKVKKDDFVYLDPPYHPVSKTANFTKYHAKDFDICEQETLKNTLDKLSSKGVKFLLSNSDVTYIRDIYKEYDIVEVKAARKVNCKKMNRGKITELLIKNYEIR